jgi:hypothetical protein
MEVFDSTFGFSLIPFRSYRGIIRSPHLHKRNHLRPRKNIVRLMRHFPVLSPIVEIFAHTDKRSGADRVLILNLPIFLRDPLVTSLLGCYPLPLPIRVNSRPFLVKILFLLFCVSCLPARHSAFDGGGFCGPTFAFVHANPFLIRVYPW